MSPLQKYWVASVAGFALAGAGCFLLFMIADQTKSYAHRALLFIAASICSTFGANLYFWGANYIGRCPRCGSWIKNNLTIAGFLPSGACQKCGRDLRLAHSPADREAPI
jgi:hypothetical protein